MKREHRMPQCVGVYEEGDAQCDGNPNGKDDDERAPCLCRDRCVALGRLMKDTGRERSTLIRLRTINEGQEDEETFAEPKADPGKFAEVINRTISTYGIKNGRVTKRAVAKKGKPKPKPKKPPKVEPEKRAEAGKAVSPAGRKAAAQGRAATSAKAREDANELVSWLTKQLQEKCGRQIADFGAGDAAEGEFILVDRLDKSRYAAVYGKKAGGSRLPICNALPNSMNGTLQVRIAVPLEAYSKLLTAEQRSKLSPEDYSGKDGAFTLRIRNLDKERITMVAESIAKAINKGIIDLPEVHG